MSPIRTKILCVVSLCVAGSLPLSCARQIQNPKAKQTQTSLVVKPENWASSDPTPNDGRDYKEAVAKLEAERIQLGLRYQQSSSAAQHAEVIAQARAVVTEAIYQKIFPSWYGTPWDFNGATEVPQQGKIACGYFVSTVLRDAGWHVQRVRLAQQPSENIILSLTTDPYVKRFRRVPVSDLVSAVQQWGTGLYVVGLDIHVGFIVNTGSEVYFIHSSYGDPYTVVREKAIESKILAASKYRVLGKITADDQLIEKWLLQQDVVTRTT
ncbi:MAG TPA: hypothetical protein VLL54_02360 [Pyrinomonadaceae bacterium]|nr:hypothetical protein [Pyrinomonadaceae bacterium]